MNEKLLAPNYWGVQFVENQAVISRAGIGAVPRDEAVNLCVHLLVGYGISESELAETLEKMKG